MKTKEVYKGHKYQLHATDHVIDNPEAALFLDMGLGKTVITFNALYTLMFEKYEVFKVLIIAPLTVAQSVWVDERDKWEHLSPFKLSHVLGTADERKAALKKKAHIYIINRENVPWLVNHYKMRFPFDMVVIDELSSFKSHKAQRYKTLKMVRPKVKRILGLTGTPAPNSLLDLWAQMDLIDQGKRLFRTYAQYRDTYFTPASKFMGFGRSYKLRIPAKQDVVTLGKDYFSKQIYKKINDICISMSAEDYLELPPVIYREIYVDLSTKTKKQYDDFEREQVLSLNEGEDEISAVSAAALSTKLRQFANGAIYDEDKNIHAVHDFKLDKLEELIDVANGQPVLVFYWFKHDLERLLKRFPKAEVFDKKSAKSTVDRWNKGEIQILLAQPIKTQYGLNMQEGGCLIFWYALTWSLEALQQANARLYRQGQKLTVIINRLIARGTIDERILESNINKEEGQSALLKAVKAIYKKHTGKKLQITSTFKTKKHGKLTTA